MPDFSRWMPGAGEPSPAAVARADRLLDALAAEQPVPVADGDDAALASVLAGWRDDLRQPPATGLVSARAAVAALDNGLKSRRRTRTGFAFVASAAATLLFVGGFSAVVYGAGPGDSLYGLHAMLFGQPTPTRNDPVVLAAQTELEQAQDLIAQGQWQQAQDKLTAVTNTVGGVSDSQTQQNLLEQWNRLNVQVQARDPNATPPPGPTEVSLPGGVTVQLPVGEPPATSPTDSSTTTATTPTTTSSTTDTSSTTETSVEGSSPASEVPGVTTTPTTPTTSTTNTTPTTPATTSSPTTTRAAPAPSSTSVLAPATSAATTMPTAPAASGEPTPPGPPSPEPAPHQPPVPAGPTTTLTFAPVQPPARR